MFWNKPGTILECEDYSKQLKVPFIIYADVECLNIPVNEKPGESTDQISKKVPCSFCFIVVRSDGLVIDSMWDWMQP